MNGVKQDAAAMTLMSSDPHLRTEVLLKYGLVIKISCQINNNFVYQNQEGNNECSASFKDQDEN